MMTAWTVLLPLAQQAPDPSQVGQGLAGFLVFVGLCVGVVLLWLSFRKQLKKINFEEREDGEKSADQGKHA